MKFKENIAVGTDDFHYDLFQGRIKLEDILIDKEDIIKLKEAIKTINDFENELTRENILYYF